MIELVISSGCGAGTVGGWQMLCMKCRFVYTHMIEIGSFDYKLVIMIV